ncbi:MAG: bifunctional hydroxymethylpyrimidine kinase/phosphomethylpyrimidine kinase [Pseudomonadota bacterium]
MTKGRVLIIAGSDSGGGAGIQADIKTVTALGGFAATAVTAITVQDTTGVHAVEPVSDAVVRQQIDVVLEDIGADCIKIGMIGGRRAGEVIADTLRRHAGIPVVLDPVLVATSGDALGDGSVASLIRDDLLSRATVITPNVPEMEVLTGIQVLSEQDLVEGGKALIAAGAQAVLAKGGHLEGATLIDYLITDQDVRAFSHDRLDTRHTHGTGCTLASAVATGLAQGMALEQATERAVRYVEAAIRYAPGFGAGHGPLRHALTDDGAGGFKPIS